jgi:hypothetical protein
VLPHHICIVKWFADEEKDLIEPVKGLEKNNRYPATGVIGLQTQQTIRPGMANDIIRIPIYEGECEYTNPDLNNLIFELVITGESLPALLPKGSDVDITIKVDKSGLIKCSAYFPILEYTEELEIPHKPNEVPETNEAEAKTLTDDLFWLKDELLYDFTDGKADVGRIQYHDQNFNFIKWKDSSKARVLINRGLQAISNGETRTLRAILYEIWSLRIDKDDDGTTLT